MAIARSSTSSTLQLLLVAPGVTILVVAGSIIVLADVAGARALASTEEARAGEGEAERSFGVRVGRRNPGKAKARIPSLAVFTARRIHQ
jgi:hypothetical protein